MNSIREKIIVNEIADVMKNKNYRCAYEHAIELACEMKITERTDFFPFIFALDIRGEVADQFINEVLNKK